MRWNADKFFPTAFTLITANLKTIHRMHRIFYKNSPKNLDTGRPKKSGQWYEENPIKNAVDIGFIGCTKYLIVWSNSFLINVDVNILCKKQKKSGKFQNHISFDALLYAAKYQKSQTEHFETCVIHHFARTHSRNSVEESFWIYLGFFGWKIRKREKSRGWSVWLTWVCFFSDINMVWDNNLRHWKNAFRIEY